MKHASLKRYLSLFLALVLVVGIIPANLFHAHATEAENPAVVVEDGGNVVINDSSNVVVSAPTKGVTNENTRVEIDYNYQQYQTDKDGNLILDQNGKPIPVTAMNALSFESEKNRELSYTYPNSTKPLDFDYYWSSSNKTKWNQVFKGDYTRNGGKLRELLESTDPDHKYIVLMEDIKCTVDFGKDYDPPICLRSRAPVRLRATKAEQAAHSLQSSTLQAPTSSIPIPREKPAPIIPTE